MAKRRLTVNLIGMDCSSCEKSITKAVKGVEGVERVVASPVLNKIFLYVDDGTDFEKLKRRIAGTGIRCTLSRA